MRKRHETYVRLRRAQLELDESYSGLLDSCGTTAALDNLLTEHQTINHLTVVNDTSGLLQDANVLKIDIIGGLGVDDLEDRVDSHGGELGFL